MSTATVNYPLVYSRPPIIRLAIVYNPFMLSDVTKHELIYDQDKTLEDYMNGLPEEAGWCVAYNGVGIEREAWSEIKPLPFSNICLVRVPEGGGGSSGGGKSILRIVALVAVLAFAAWAGPALAGSFLTAALPGTIGAQGAFFTSIIGLAGASLVNAILPATVAPQKGPAGATYGINGPKNTAQEGVPIPIVYGTMRVGGNITDCYTRNIGDDQYLFMRTALNDGPVSNIYDLQINQQDITQYPEVEYRVHLGNGPDTTNDWFSEAIRMNTVNERISNSFTTYITATDVDRLRLDVSFPNGLIRNSSKIAATYAQSVTFVIQYRPLNEDATPAGAWSNLPLDVLQPIDVSGTSGTYVMPTFVQNATMTILPAEPTEGSTWTVQGYYRKVGDTAWITGPSYSGRPTGLWVVGQNGASNVPTSTDYIGLNAGAFANISNDASAVGGNIATGAGYYENIEAITFKWNFPSQDNWEVYYVGGAVQDDPTTDNSAGHGTSLPGSTDPLTVTQQTTSPFRLTYESSKLTRGRYEVQIQRTDAESLNPYLITQCWLTDIAEIDDDNVGYDGTAMVSLKVKLGGQINSMPQLTALVDGCIVNTYDEEGTVVSAVFSQNPAWIACDILTNTLRGSSLSSNKIIWPQMVEFAEFCDASSLKFNGVFDFVTNVWDAVQSVARIGHGTFIPQGTSYTVAIDRQDDPVMAFTGANMYMDTFKKSWTNQTDRANEIQQQFYDELSNYVQKTIRLPNAAILSTGVPVKPASVSGFGITNVAQATAEAEYQARLNSYSLSTVVFDAPLEAVALSIGDVAIVQHDSIAYGQGVGGRLDTGSTTTNLVLDRPVTMTAGNTYSIMTVTDAILRYTVSIASIAGNRVTVTGIPSGVIPRLRRLIQGVHDVEITYIVPNPDGTYRLTVEDASNLTNGAAADLWDTDVIEERQVELVVGDSMSVTLTAPLETAPHQFTNFLFGQSITTQQLFRLKAIGGQEDLYRRTLTFAQYDERVYEPGSWGVPTLTQGVVPLVNQVTSPQIDYSKTPAAGQTQLKVSLSWGMPLVTIYGGADIYVQVNGAAWTVADTVQNVTSWQGDYTIGDTLIFKIVAYDNIGNRAIFSQAPQVGATLQLGQSYLSDPTNLAFTVSQFTTTATANVTWTAPAASAGFTYRVELKALTGADYATFVEATDPTTYPATITEDTGYGVIIVTPDVQANLPGLIVGDYSVRMRAEKGYQFSDWIYLPMAISNPAMPEQVTGLRINDAYADASTGVFNTLDAFFTWDDVLTQASGLTGVGVNGLAFFWLDYRVRILDASNNVLRTEYVTQPSYAYTFQKNAADSTGLTGGGTARRAFKFEVSMRGAQGQLSNPVVMSVSNPPPALGAVTAASGVDGVTITYTDPTDQDFTGIIVWASTTSGFTPGVANVVYFGTGNASFYTQSFTTYYYRYAFYDAYGTDSLNTSSEYSILTAGVDGNRLAQTIRDEISSAVGSDTANAATYAANALSSENAAETSAQNAAGAATAASTSAAAASTAATSAAASETSASDSAALASTSATTAANSAASATNSATAASTSSTQAATYSTQAGSYASSATSSANLATTQAGDAQSAATNAQISATNASNSAVKANSSATLSAQMGTGAALNNDPTFQNWPTTSNPANTWLNSISCSQQTTNLLYGGSALQLSCTASQTDSYLGLNTDSFPIPSDLTFIVFEWEVTLNAGDFKQAGYGYAQNYTSGNKSAAIHLFDEHPAPIVGQTYRGRRFYPLVASSSPSPTGALTGDYGYVFGNSTHLDGGSPSAKNFTTHRLTIRAATDSEITAQQALVNSDANAAQITTNNTAFVNAQTAFATQLTTISSVVNDHSSLITENATALTTLTGQAYATYTLRADANGSMVGMQLLASNGSGVSTSAVIFNAANFEIFTGTSSTPVFGTSGDTITMQNVVIHGGLVLEGSLTGTQIAIGGIATSNVTNSAINRITIGVGGSVSNVANGTNTYNLVTVSVVKDLSDSSMRVEGAFTCSLVSDHTSIGIVLDVYRDTTLVATTSGQVFPGYNQTLFAVTFDEDLPAGTYNYLLNIRGVGGSPFNVSNSLIVNSEIKR